MVVAVKADQTVRDEVGKRTRHSDFFEVVPVRKEADF